MRNVTLCALQTADLGCDPKFYSLSENFERNPETILKEHVMPRLELNAELIARCAGSGARIALTTENVCGMYPFMLADRPFVDVITQRSGDLADEFFSALAKKHQLHIAACYNKRIGGKNYNVTSIFAPNGQLAGEYRKTHLPPDEMWHLEDGDELNVIELDFGKVGVLICYDIMFPEAASALALQGAEIILHPTAGYGWYDAIGEATLRTRANDNSVYILTAKNYVYNGAGKSSIIDPWGHALADAGFYKNVTVHREIDLDERKVQADWHTPSQMSGIADVRKRYLQERRPALYGKLTEPAARLRTPGEAEREVLRERIRKGECHW